MPTQTKGGTAMGRLKGKVAVVTGGSRGIGAAIARRYGAEGARVAVVYKAAADAADEVVADIKAAGSEATAIRCDVAQTKDCNTMADAVAAAFGGADILVNNAGIYLLTTLGETSEDEWDSQMNTNVKGAYFVAQALLPQMIARGGGKIINIGSISAYTSSPARGEYCISKAGVGMMTLLFADRLAESGINVCEVRPGIVETDMTSTVKEKYDKLIGDGLTPIRRWGQPEDVGKAVTALAEGLFPFSTGAVLDVDGGFHMHRL
jgi:NAD(P)-dependent dehydrogenase (short-subunit alcohol dehydrogenase family)